MTKVAAAVTGNRLTDVDSNAVSQHLQRLRDAGRSAWTVNQHRATAVAFINWCVEKGRLSHNPIARLPKLDESLDRRRKRRAATEDELGRLFASIPDKRRPHYLTAVLTGLRRKEMKLLEVRDIRFEDDQIHVRPEVDKESHEHFLPLPAELKAELRALIPDGADPRQQVFDAIPLMRTVRADLARAGIPYKDEHDRQLDLHALRSTHATRLLRAGVPVAKARLLTRHRESRTLERHYNMLGHRDAVAALNAVPALPVLSVPGNEVESGSNPTAAKTAVDTAPEAASERGRGRTAARGEATQAPGTRLDTGAQACYSTELDGEARPDAPAGVDGKSKCETGKDLRAVGAAG